MVMAMPAVAINTDDERYSQNEEQFGDMILQEALHIIKQGPFLSSLEGTRINQVAGSVKSPNIRWFSSHPDCGKHGQGKGVLKNQIMGGAVS